MPEISEYLDKKIEKQGELGAFVKKFNELSVKDAKDLRKGITNLNILKIREDHLAKLIDLLPENQDDLNKIFTGIGLDEDESKKILDEIKKFK